MLEDHFTSPFPVRSFWYLLWSDTPRVYSLKKWDVVELDFLHCLVLGLCEEEEGHLEAMRSL